MNTKERKQEMPNGENNGELNMKRFLIEDAKCGIAQGGPMIGIVITSVKFNDGESSKWFNLAEVDGIPCFYVTDKDVYDTLIENDFDEEFQEMFDKSHIDEFNGIFVGGEYDEVFDSIYENPENPAVAFIRYVIALTRCELKDVKKLIKRVVGKYVDEIKVPISDAEDEYLFDKE